MSPKEDIQTVCAYCGDPCLEDRVLLNGSSYCCYGCATLDDVVSRIHTSKEDVRIEYKQFDLPERFDQLVDFQNDKLYRLSIDLPNIHCSSCVELLEDLPSFHEHLLRSSVNFEQRRATILARKELPLSVLAQLLDDIGYPPRISLGQKQRQQEKIRQRRELFKMGFAGFCFGNIMFYTMPHYFGLNAGIDPFFSALFLYISVALSIPVMFYAGLDYLRSAYKALASNSIHINVPIAIGMLSLWGWSLYEIIGGTGSGYLDSLSGLVFFLLVGKWFQTKIYDQVSFQRHVTEFIPLVVRKQNGHTYEWVELGQLNMHDRIQVRSNEIIPVDGILRSPHTLVDYSFISGEEAPEEVVSGARIFTGGRQLGGAISIELDKKPDVQTLWANWSQHTRRPQEKSWTNTVSRYFTLAVLGIALLTGVLWYFIDPSRIPFVCSAVLIVACPCALALSAPFTYGNILRVYSRNSFFVKDPASIQQLGRAEHVVFDKTGTLTQAGKGMVSFEGDPLSNELQAAVSSLASMSTHPMSQMIVDHLGLSEITVTDFVEEAGMGIRAEVEGTYIRLGSPLWIGGGADLDANVALEVDGIYRGAFRVKGSYRDEVEAVLNRLGRLVKLHVLSGDNQLERSRLQEMFPAFERLEFNMTPTDKEQVVREIQSLGPTVMVGDGINDGIALHRSNFGIALTESLNGFYPGADAVLMSTQFRVFPKLLELARNSKTVMRIGLAFSLFYNIIGVAFAVSGTLTPIVAAILMPLSSVSVVGLNTLLVRSKAKQLRLI